MITCNIDEETKPVYAHSHMLTFHNNYECISVQYPKCMQFISTGSFSSTASVKPNSFDVRHEPGQVGIVLWLLERTGTMEIFLFLLQQNSGDDGHDKDTKEKEKHRNKDNSPKAASSPTLAELNTEGPRMKRPALPSSYSPPNAATLPPHFSSAVSDSSSSSQPPPRLAFAEREGYDDLSASFRSLYKSIFGQSVNGGEYLNATTTEDAFQISVPSIDPTCSNSSLPLGASAASLFIPGHENYSPQLTSLMDSFRDIAETNSWDKLDPAQIHGLMESFKAGEHDKFGLDPDMYANLSASFTQFLSQLNNKFLVGGSASVTHLNEYHQSHLSRMPQAHMMSRLPPKYGRQADSLTAYSIHQTSPPSSSYHSANRTPSPHISPPSAHIAPLCGPITSSHSHMDPHYTSFLTPIQGHTPPLASSAQPTDTPDVPIRSAATDLFDEEDDFDWSKLM